MPTLVVGAGPGMGRAIAAALGLEHGPVALVARRPDSLDRLTRDLADVGVTAAGFAADITDTDALRAAIADARTTVGPFTVVVHNASSYVAGPPTQVDVAAFQAGLATGITAALVTLQATAGDLLAAAGRSCVLFTGGGLALNPWPDAIGLAVQKAGLRHLALATASELRPSGVSVSIVTIRGTVEPGGPFDPDRIASVFAALARSGGQRPVEVMVDAAGPDWPAHIGA